MKEVKIRPVLNGWVVFVGCQEVVFIELDLMISELRRYILSPDHVEKEYIAKAVNIMSILLQEQIRKSREPREELTRNVGGVGSG